MVSTDINWFMTFYFLLSFFYQIYYIYDNTKTFGVCVLSSALMNYYSLFSIINVNCSAYLCFCFSWHNWRNCNGLSELQLQSDNQTSWCQTNLSKTSTLLVYDGFRYFKLFFFFENPTGCVLLLLPIVHKASIRIQILQQEYRIMEFENEIINSVDNCTGPNPTESFEWS